MVCQHVSSHIISINDKYNCISNNSSISMCNIITHWKKEYITIYSINFPEYSGLYNMKIIYIFEHMQIIGGLQWHTGILCTRNTNITPYNRVLLNAQIWLAVDFFAITAGLSGYTNELIDISDHWAHSSMLRFLY